MTTFDKYRKAAEKRPMSAALAELEALITTEQSSLYQQVFLNDISSDEANRRVLNLLKILFLAADVEAFFAQQYTKAQAEKLKDLASQMAQALKTQAPEKQRTIRLQELMQEYFLGMEKCPQQVIPSPKGKQQTLFH